MTTVKEQLTSPSLSPSPCPDKDSNNNLNHSRCEFTFSDGRRCCNALASRCAHHASKQKRGGKRAALKAPELEALCSDLTTTTSINRALAQTFLLMAQGRISRKDAVAFGYLSQLLLQSVSGVRAEFVAANGYRQWENNLKSRLERVREDGPPPPPENPGDGQDGVILSESAAADERRIPPNVPQERPLAERIMGEPDYGDILSRSPDMLDRKYDTTPEGRNEAQKLALEIELMKPAPAKPAKDFFGQTVALMRRFRDAEQQESDGASIPPALNYYGHPIQTYVEPPPWADERDAPPVPPPSHKTASPTEPAQHASSLASVAAAVPTSQRSCAPSASDPADSAAPPSRRHRKPRSRSSAPSNAPLSELPSPLPISATTANPDSVNGPDGEHREGHRTD